MGDNMLDDFIDIQPVVYKVLKNALDKNRISHAYLFELNGYPDGFVLARSFAKFLLCPHSYSNNSKCNNCSICNNIDNNNHIEFKIIEPEGQWIKKEQLQELQKEFNQKSLTGSRKVYIIKDAEKLNVQSSNSLLKFLEEPPSDVVAILLTNNMYQLLNTIISRCQIISLKKDDNNYNNSIEKIGKFLYTDEEEYNEFIENHNKYIDTIIEYVLFIEKNKYEAIIYKNKELVEIFNDRNKLFIAFNLLILYYKDVLNKKLGLSVDYFSDYLESIDIVSLNNDKIKLSEKIKILVELSMKIKYNLNANLLVDKLVILLSEV